jgi:hypothetical protein
MDVGIEMLKENPSVTISQAFCTPLLHHQRAQKLPALQA